MKTSLLEAELLTIEAKLKALETLHGKTTDYIEGFKEGWKQRNTLNLKENFPSEFED